MLATDPCLCDIPAFHDQRRHDGVLSALNRRGTKQVLLVQAVVAVLVLLPGSRVAIAYNTPFSDDSALIPEAAITVSLNVENADGGWSVGMGTIVGASKGKALILTCGHIFRDHKETQQIAVRLPGRDRSAKPLTGELLYLNVEGDVGLVVVQTTRRLQVAKVAPSGYQVPRGDRVTCMGFGGDRPVLRESSVTFVDRFVGPPNIQVAGRPPDGSSGGGLYWPNGQLMGVCNAYDPADDEGFFAGLATIQSILRHAGDW